MKILVCIKEVVSRDSRLEIDRDGKWINETMVSFEASECDEFALEEALRLREKFGGEVVVITIGQARAEKVVRKALAMGADRGILVVDASRRLSDPQAVASVLAEIVKKEASFDLVLTGTQSDDFGYSQTGVALAELLGIPHATLVMQIAAEPPQTIKVLREMESGSFQWVRLALPALLTIQAGSSPIRFVALTGIMKAKSKPLLNIPLESLDSVQRLSGEITIERLYEPQIESKAVIIDGGDPAGAAQRLAVLLQDEAKVI